MNVGETDLEEMAVQLTDAEWATLGQAVRTIIIARATAKLRAARSRPWETYGEPAPKEGDR